MRGIRFSSLCAALLLQVWPADQAHTQTLHVRSEPVLELGTRSDDAPPLARVRSGARTATGYVLADATIPGLIFFDAEGRFVRRVGRAGKGPGEFTAPSWVGRCRGDSLVVWDGQEFQFSVFDAFGRFAHSFRAPVGGSQAACSGDGTLALLLNPRRIDPPDSRDPKPPKGSMRILNQRGDSIGTIADLPMDGRIFGPHTTFAMSGNRVYVSGTDNALVAVHDFAGRQLQRIDLGLPRRTTSEEDKERFVDHMLDNIRIKGPDRERQRAALLAMPIPQHHPAFRDLRVAPDGTIWVNLSWPEDGSKSAQLKAFGPDGRPRGESLLPHAVRLLEAGNDYLMLAWQSDDGEPHVGIFRITP